MPLDEGLKGPLGAFVQILAQELLVAHIAFSLLLYIAAADGAKPKCFFKDFVETWDETSSAPPLHGDTKRLDVFEFKF